MRTFTTMRRSRLRIMWNLPESSRRGGTTTGFSVTVIVLAMDQVVKVCVGDLCSCW